jgi:hypothetical protein
MQHVQNLAFFEVEIGGVSFKMRRRSTALMLQIGDVGSVFGLLAEARKKEATAESAKKAAKAYAEMLQKTIEIALVEIDGQPVESLGILAGELIHVSDPLFGAFMDSGLKADPMPGSSEGGME